ncbi:MAG TPA: hypothetical protein VEG39_08475 [Clostridia bacterium]|nr:hypothetical protein [Clostridia bacterium]
MTITETAREIRSLYGRSCEVKAKWDYLVTELNNASLEDRKDQFNFYFENAAKFEDSMRVNIDRLKKDGNITKDILLDALVEAGKMLNPEIWDCLYKRVCAKFCPDLHSKMTY